MFKKRNNRLEQRWLLLFVKILTCLLSVATAEEARFHSNAIVTPLWSNWVTNSSDPQALLYGSSKARVMLDSGIGTLGDYSKGFKFDFGISQKLSLAFITNVYDSTNSQKRMGNSRICIGNDGSSPTAAANNCLSQRIYDGGFQDLKLFEGRYLYLYRVGSSISDQGYNLSHLRLYQTPNLVNSAT